MIDWKKVAIDNGLTMGEFENEILNTDDLGDIEMTIKRVTH